MAARSGGPSSTGAPEAAGPKRHGVGQQALDQVVGGVLEGGTVVVGKTAKAEPNPSGGFLDGQGQAAIGHGSDVPRHRPGVLAGLRQSRDSSHSSEATCHEPSPIWRR
jgi:hypothetical protein